MSHVETLPVARNQMWPLPVSRVPSLVRQRQASPARSHVRIDVRTTLPHGVWQNRPKLSMSDLMVKVCTHGVSDSQSNVAHGPHVTLGGRMAIYPLNYGPSDDISLSDKWEWVRVRFRYPVDWTVQ